MKKLTNWLFVHWYIKRLRKLQTSPHRFKNETDGIRANCIAEILNEIEDPWVKMSQLQYWHGTRFQQKATSAIYRDEFDKEHVKTKPVFSSSQVANINSKWAVQLFLILVLSGVEAFFYYLTASTFLNGVPEYLKVIFGGGFAVGFICVIDYGIKSYFQYLDALAGQISDTKLREYKFKRNAAYLFIAGVCAALICAGMSRIYFFENIDDAGLSAAEAQSVFLANKWGSMVALLFTVLVTFLVGFYKYEFSKLNRQRLEYRAWCKVDTNVDGDALEIIYYARKINHIVEEKTGKYWLLVVDLKRIFSDREYDEKYEAFHDEYWQIRILPRFTVTDEIYRKYAMLQSAYEELFKFGVKNDPVVKDKIGFVMELLAMSKEQIAEFLSTLTKQTEHNPAIPTFSLNGIHKKEELITN